MIGREDWRKEKWRKRSSIGKRSGTILVLQVRLTIQIPTGIGEGNQDNPRIQIHQMIPSLTDITREANTGTIIIVIIPIGNSMCSSEELMVDYSIPKSRKCRQHNFLHLNLSKELEKLNQYYGVFAMSTSHHRSVSFLKEWRFPNSNAHVESIMSVWIAVYKKVSFLKLKSLCLGLSVFVISVLWQEPGASQLRFWCQVVQSD